MGIILAIALTIGIASVPARPLPSRGHSRSRVARDNVIVLVTYVALIILVTTVARTIV